jgi:hypothetical protein
VSVNDFYGILRPERFLIVPDENKGLRGEVKKVSFMGSHYELVVQVSDGMLLVNSSQAYQPTDIIFISL